MCEDCDHEFEMEEVSIFQNSPQTVKRPICQKCGIDREELDAEN